MRAFIRKRPWVIIVAVQILFCSWWIVFVCYAAQHTPEDVAPTADSHGRN